MSVLRLSLLQQPLIWQDAAANRAHFGALLAPLAGHTDLVVLPETFTTGFSMEVARLGEPAGGATVEWLRGQAAALGAAVMGSVITQDGPRYFNRLLFVLPEGEVRHYDERHLFRMGGEHEQFTAGREVWSLSWRGLRICPLVCYDLRFPVFSRRRAQLDYDLLVYVANWPAARADARASCYGRVRSRISATWSGPTGLARTASTCGTRVTASPWTTSGGRCWNWVSNLRLACQSRQRAAGGVP